MNDINYFVETCFTNVVFTHQKKSKTLFKKKLNY